MPKKLPSKNSPKRKQLFDWTCGLTQSALTQFQACREQFSLNYIEGITHKAFSKQMEFGTIIHFAIQNQELIKGHKTATDLISEITEHYHVTRYPKMRNEADRLSFVQMLAAAECLFPIYHKHNIEDDAQQKWVAREQLFCVPYEVPLNGLGSFKIDLRGMRDGAYRTKRQGCLGLFETKTKTSIDDNQIVAGLRADLQTMFYLTTMELEFAESPKEVLYNVIRRPGQKFLDRDDLKSFRARISKDIESRPDYYFRRWQVAILKHDLITFRRTVLDPALVTMRHWWESVKEDPFDRFKSPYHYLNLNALYTKYGVAQLYSYLVLAKHRDYFVRSSVFPELDPVPALKAG